MKFFLSSHHEVNSTSLVTFLKSTFTSQTIKILIQYKKHTLPLTNFVNFGKGFISSNAVSVILEDFNINAFQENDRLENVLSSYNQNVAASTHISGLLLDQIYIHHELTN